MLINCRYGGGHGGIHLYMVVDIEDKHYTIFFCYLDQNRNPNINNRDHLVGRPTILAGARGRRGDKREGGQEVAPLTSISRPPHAIAQLCKLRIVQTL